MPALAPPVSLMALSAHPADVHVHTWASFIFVAIQQGSAGTAQLLATPAQEPPIAPVSE